MPGWEAKFKQPRRGGRLGPIWAHCVRTRISVCRHGTEYSRIVRETSVSGMLRKGPRRGARRPAEQLSFNILYTEYNIQYIRVRLRFNRRWLSLTHYVTWHQAVYGTVVVKCFVLE